MLGLVLSCFVMPCVERSGSEVGRVRDCGKSVGACEDEREKERKTERDKERKKEKDSFGIGNFSLIVAATLSLLRNNSSF